jgi:hypothetical protein
MFGACTCGVTGMPAVRAGRLVLRRRRAATSVAGGRARLNSGRSSPVCSVRSQLLRSAGRLLLPCDGPRVERGTLARGLPCGLARRGPCCTLFRRPPATGVSRIFAAGSGRLWQGASARCQVLSQVKLCEKELRTARFNLALFLRTRLSGCWRGPHISSQRSTTVRRRT